MPTIATTLVLFFILITFGVRALLQWKRTGKTGFVGLRPGAGALERFAGALLGLIVVAAPIAPWVGAPLWTRGQGLGLLLAMSGFALTFLAQLQMGGSWRVGVDDRERTELVTHGIFSWVRNPIFSAMTLAICGLALAVPTPLALLLPPLLILSLQLQVRLVEEPYLLATHGEAYRRWASRTGRFVPGLGRMRAST